MWFDGIYLANLPYHIDQTMQLARLTSHIISTSNARTSYTLFYRDINLTSY
jgi:hypothetical protein